jgi:putative FmdB family regulatory protein
MPTYEYRCVNNHFYQETRGIKEDQKETLCKDCGESLSQIYHSPGVQLKGGGFYKNSR